MSRLISALLGALKGAAIGAASGVVVIAPGLLLCADRLEALGEVEAVVASMFAAAGASLGWCIGAWLGFMEAGA